MIKYAKKAIIVFLIFSVLIIVYIFGKSDRLLNNNISCNEIVAIFGKPLDFHFELHEGKDTVLNVFYIFEKNSFESKIRQLQSEYEIIESIGITDNPPFWAPPHHGNTFRGNLLKPVR